MPATDDQGGDDRTAPTVVVFKPVGLSAPIGYIGLTAGASVLAAFHFHWIAATQQDSVAVALLAFVVPLQVLAGAYALGARDTQVGTEFLVLAGTWATIGVQLLRAPVGSVSSGLGVLLLVAGIGLLSAFLAALQSRLVPAAVVALAGLHLLGDAAYQFSDSNWVRVLTGIIGLALAAIGLYAAVAMELEEAHGRTVLPLGRRGAGRAAIDGSFAEQTAGIANSPGVRQRL
jgi:succinate-acetate transporter protein